MRVQIAKRIADLLNGSPEPSRYKCIKALPRGTVTDFHHWADGHKAEVGFLFERNEDGARYWLLVIEWNVSIGYYLVIYPENRSGPISEIHRFTGSSGLTGELSWIYSPRKRDDQNKARKEYFRSIFLSTEVQISIPEGIGDTDILLDEIFFLADSRLKADTLDPGRPVGLRQSFPEGRRVEKLHKARERNQAVVTAAKSKALVKYNKLTCECCDFDFKAVYGSAGEGFIEAHHVKPLGELDDEGAETSIEDIALVCANCHRMLHRIRPWLTSTQFRARFFGANA